MDVKDQKRFVSVMNVLVETAGQGHKVKKKKISTARDKHHIQGWWHEDTVTGLKACVTFYREKESLFCF